MEQKEQVIDRKSLKKEMEYAINSPKSSGQTRLLAMITWSILDLADAMDKLDLPRKVEAPPF